MARKLGFAVCEPGNRLNRRNGFVAGFARIQLRVLSTNPRRTTNPFLRLTG